MTVPKMKHSKAYGLFETDEYLEQQKSALQRIK